MIELFRRDNRERLDCFRNHPESSKTAPSVSSVGVSRGRTTRVHSDHETVLGGITEYIQIMKQCWAESPEVRPDFDNIHSQFKEFNKGKYETRRALTIHSLSLRFQLGFNQVPIMIQSGSIKFGFRIGLQLGSNPVSIKFRSCSTSVDSS